MKIIRKIFSGALALTVALTAFTGCSSSSGNAAEQNAEKKKFNLGHLNSTAHLLGFVAKEEGFFDEEGLDVTLTQLTSSTELVNSL
ncbi:MAG: ABC transporter substrate-binding protein, partial [Oscillospiraceae bacterium]|nr:ABC transporter substrate-binding protein [Oscillospiraceae bacterium]